MPRFLDRNEAVFPRASCLSFLAVASTACGSESSPGCHVEVHDIDSDADEGGDADDGSDGVARAYAGGDADAAGAVFSMDVLHELELDVDHDDLEQLDEDRDDRVPCTFRLDGIEVAGAGVRLKGGVGSVSDLEGKPGLSIKLDEFVEGLNLLGLHKLILNNLKQDESMVSEHLGYEMYRRVGIPAPRTSYGWLTINGEAYGVYLIVEAVNGDFTERNFGDDSGNLYEGPCCGDLQLGYTELKNNGELSGDTSDLAALIEVAWNSADDDFVDDVSAILDVDEYLRGWALEAVVGHWDSYSYNRNNFYLYDRPSDGRFVFLPHGLDQLFEDIEYDIFTEPKGILSARFSDDPVTLDRWQDEMLTIVDEDWDEVGFLARIDEAAALIADAVDEDPRKFHSTDTQRARVDELRAFVRQRPAVVRQMNATCGSRALEGQ